MPRRPCAEQRLHKYHERNAIRSKADLREHLALTLEQLKGRTPSERAEGLQSLLVTIRQHEACTRDMVEEITQILEENQRIINS